MNDLFRIVNKYYSCRFIATKIRIPFLSFNNQGISAFKSVWFHCFVTGS